MLVATERHMNKIWGNRATDGRHSPVKASDVGADLVVSAPGDNITNHNANATHNRQPPPPPIHLATTVATNSNHEANATTTTTPTTAERAHTHNNSVGQPKTAQSCP